MPSLIIPIMGDSNAGFGSTKIASDDTIYSNIWLLDRSTIATTPAIVPCTEAVLDALNGTKGNLSMGGGVGSTLALCKLLSDRGKIPPAYDKIIIVGSAWSGTAMVNQWAVTGSRTAIDMFISQVQAALGLDSANRIWFFDQAGFGANCGGDASFQSESVAMFAEMRGLRTGASAPVLISPSPPDRAAASLGGSTSLTAITAIQANCANWLANSYYIDPTGLPSEMGVNQPFIHYSAASQRGGVDNSSTSNPNYSSGTWFWDASVTYASGNHVLGSDNFCYNSKNNGNVNHNPVSDGGVNWTLTTYQYGRTITDPLSERKYRTIVNNPAFYQFSGNW